LEVGAELGSPKNPPWRRGSLFFFSHPDGGPYSLCPILLDPRPVSSENINQRTMRVLAFILSLAGTAYQVAAQSHPEASTSAVILDANGNQAALGKK